MGELTEKEIELFRMSKDVRDQIDKLTRTAEAHARGLKTLIGKRVTNTRGTYEITSAYGYQGRIAGRGRKVLKDGTIGHKNWDLHAITEHCFEA